MRDVIEENECGRCTQPRDPVALAKVIEDLLDDPDQLKQFRMNARRAAIEKYSKGKGGRDVFSNTL